MRLLVTRASSAKNHSVKVLIESTVADDDDEAKEVFDGGKAERMQTFSKALCFHDIADVDRGIITQECFFCVPFLLFDSSHTSGRSGKSTSLSGIKPTVVLASHSVSKQYPNLSGSFSYTL